MVTITSDLNLFHETAVDRLCCLPMTSASDTSILTQTKTCVSLKKKHNNVHFRFLWSSQTQTSEDSVVFFQKKVSGKMKFLGGTEPGQESFIVSACFVGSVPRYGGVRLEESVAVTSQTPYVGSTQLFRGAVYLWHTLADSSTKHTF